MSTNKFEQMITINPTAPAPDGYRGDMDCLIVKTPCTSANIKLSEAKEIAPEADTTANAGSAELITHPKFGVVGVIINYYGNGGRGKPSADEFYYAAEFVVAMCIEFQAWLDEHAVYSTPLYSGHEWRVGEHIFIKDRAYVRNDRGVQVTEHYFDFDCVEPHYRRKPVSVEHMKRAYEAHKSPWKGNGIVSPRNKGEENFIPQALHYFLTGDTTCWNTEAETPEQQIRRVLGYS